MYELQTNSKKKQLFCLPITKISEELSNGNKIVKALDHYFLIDPEGNNIGAGKKIFLDYKILGESKSLLAVKPLYSNKWFICDLDGNTIPEFSKRHPNGVYKVKDLGNNRLSIIPTQYRGLNDVEFTDIKLNILKTNIIHVSRIYNNMLLVTYEECEYRESYIIDDYGEISPKFTDLVNDIIGKDYAYWIEKVENKDIVSITFRRGDEPYYCDFTLNPIEFVKRPAV